jgi:hypothetical protein
MTDKITREFYANQSLHKKYTERGDKIFKRTLLATIIAVSFSTVPGIWAMYKMIKDNPYVASKVLIDYKDSQETLRILRSRQENMAEINLPYRPKLIEEDITKAFPDRYTRKNSIEKAITAVEKERADMRSHKDFKDYQKWSGYYDDIGRTSVLFCFGFLLAGLGIGTYLNFRNKIKMKADMKEAAR